MKIYKFGSKKPIESLEVTALLKTFSYHNNFDFYNFLLNYFTLSDFKETIIKNNRKGVILKTKDNIIAYDPDNLSFLLNRFVSGHYYNAPDEFIEFVIASTNTHVTKEYSVFRPLPIKNLNESHPEIQLYSAIRSV
jgi:hypothetical protein